MNLASIYIEYVNGMFHVIAEPHQLFIHWPESKHESLTGWLLAPWEMNGKDFHEEELYACHILSHNFVIGLDLVILLSILKFW